MKKRILAGLVILVVALSLASCGKPFIGRWESVGTTYAYYFDDFVEFSSNGTVVSDGDIGQWKDLGKNQMSVQTPYSTYVFTYDVKSGMLTIIDEDGDTNVYRKL